MATANENGSAGFKGHVRHCQDLHVFFVLEWKQKFCMLMTKVVVNKCERYLNETSHFFQENKLFKCFVFVDSENNFILYFF